MMDAFTNAGATYVSIGLSLLILGVLVGLSQGLTTKESIQREGMRCGLQEKSTVWHSFLIALIAWPYGLLRGHSA